MTRAQPAASEAPYAVRRYRPADRPGFLSLYEDVWRRPKGEAWFRWRFERNPYADGVEMVLAECDGRIVGAEPLLPLRLTDRTERVAAYQPVDWIVHPDHRRRGHFTRMTERLLEAYADRPALFFNFPSEALRPGLGKFDWTEVGPVATRYRVQRPGRAVANTKRPTSRAVSLLAPTSVPAVRAGLRVADRLTPAADDACAERVDGVDADAVRTVYAETRPDRIHLPREEQFLAWRFANPSWETTTYVARHDGRPVATVVAVTESLDAVCVTFLADVQPMTDVDGRSSAVDAILARLVADHADVDLLAAPTGPFPSVFRRRCFLRNDRFPLSLPTTPATHAARPLSTDAADAFDRDVFAADDWLLSPADRDIE